MNKLWGKTLQETMGKTVTGLSDSAARFKQGWNDKPPTPEPSSQSSSPRHNHSSPQQEKAEYVRLHRESARMLTWYDRKDIDSLVRDHFREKEVLQSTISALREHIHASGCSDDTLDSSLKERLAKAEDLRSYDEGVASVLLISLQDEARRLRSGLKAKDSQLEILNQRVAELERAGPSATGDSVPQTPVLLNITVKDGAGAGSSAGICSPGAVETARLPLEDRENSAVDHSEDLPSGRPGPGAPDGLGSGETEALMGKLRRIEEERRDYFEEMARLNDLLKGYESSAAVSSERISELESSLAAAQQTLSDTQENAGRKLHEARARFEASKTQHSEMLQRAQAICAEADEKAESMERRAEKAEARATKAEGELSESKAEARKLSSDLKGKDKEVSKLEARATTAEVLLAEAKQKGEVEKGGALSSALAAARKASDEREAELRKAMREGEAKLKERVERLENDNAALRRSCAKAEAELQVVEARILEAEEIETSLHRELRVAESAVADRDDLESCNRALQERLEETRAEQGQLANYKQIAKELEASRARTEEEIIATVRIANSLETKLQAANTARAAAESDASIAKKRSIEAEQRIEREVARKLEVIGADESQWPAAAKESLVRLSKKVEAMHDIMARLQSELDREQHILAVEQAAKQSLQNKLEAAEERLERAQRDARDATHRLEQRVASLKSEVSEWQSELAAAEAEVQRLSSAQRRSVPGMQRQHSTARNRGGGSLSPVFVEEKVNGREAGPPIDHLYLKNVLLKFIAAATQGHLEQCTRLLPAVATLLHANAQEYSALKAALQAQGTWWPQQA